ncbi:MAG: SDR family NAD(P)-dependent oxidoreductase [Roseobacter sp.]
MPNVLITGGAKRIGAHLARRFAREGFNVVIHYNASALHAETLCDELNQNRKCCWLVQGNLSLSAEIETVFEHARQAVGPIDVCINNASSFLNDDMSAIHGDHFENHMNVNLKAPVHFARLLRDQKEWAEDRLVINLLDNKVFAINPDFFTYTLSKSALLTATEMMAMQFNGTPRVCGIAPSITLISGKQTQENFEKSSRINPMSRKVFPSDICDAAVFMWKTKGYDKQVIIIDAGQTTLNLPRDVAFYIKEGLLDG